MLLVLAPPGPVSAATPAGDAAVTDKDAGRGKPEFVPAEDIPAQAAASRVALDTVRARLASVSGGEGRQLAAFDAALLRLRQQPDFSDLERLPEVRITPLQRQVRFYQRELASVQEQDIARATRLSTDAAELARMRAVWAGTLQRAIDAKLSAPLVEEARKVLEQIDEADRLLEQPLTAALETRDRAGRYEAQLETLTRRLAEASRRADERLLSRDVEPLWSQASYELMPERDATTVRLHVGNQAWYLRDFFVARRAHIEGLAVVAFAGFAVIFWLRRRPQWFADAREHVADAGHILSRPFSSLILILLAATMLASEVAPRLLVEAIAAAIFLVLLRLTPTRLVAGRSAILIGLAVLFVLDRARVLMPYESLAFRLDLLTVTLVLTAGLAWARLTFRKGRIPPESWLSLWARAAPVALLLLLVGLGANVIGNVSLADLLVRGLLSSVYVSAVLFAAALILRDFCLLLVRSRIGRSLRMVALRGDRIVEAFRRIVRLVAVAAWIYATLAAFRLWAPLASRVERMLSGSWEFGELQFTIGGVLTFVVGVFVAFYAARAIRFLLNEEVLARVPWPTGAKSTSATLVYYGVLFAGLILAFSAAGVETGQFALIVSALGVGIGFGLQNVVNNFVSGLILMFERPIQPGDIIDVDTLQGRVVEIGLRATRVQTWEGAEVVVPNGTLLSGNLINWTLSDSSRRVEVAVGVAYGTDLRRVLEILMQVAVAQPAAMKDPAPVVLFTGFGPSSLDFVMRFWTRDAATAAVSRSDAGVAVAEALATAGIGIPFPQQDVHIRSVAAAAAQSLK